MNSEAIDVLDSEELFMLGLRASTSGDSGSAVGYLKLALAKSSSHAKAHWALATEYAALNMPERAEQHFVSAIALDPSQPVARFQHGLLLLTSGRVEEASAAWKPLDDALPAEHPVRLFKDGLLRMVRDEFDVALTLLRQALATPAIDPMLARDVAMAIGRIEAAEHGDGAPTTSEDAQRQSSAAPAVSIESHLALSAYRTGADGGH